MCMHMHMCMCMFACMHACNTYTHLDGVGHGVGGVTPLGVLGEQPGDLDLEVEPELHRGAQRLDRGQLGEGDAEDAQHHAHVLRVLDERGVEVAHHARLGDGAPEQRLRAERAPLELAREGAARDALHVRHDLLEGEVAQQLEGAVLLGTVQHLGRGEGVGVRG